MATLVFVLLAYIIGSVPSGLIIGKVFYHTDLRDYGSKNIGATNAYRVLGAVPGLAVLASDMGKGLLGVYLGKTAGLAFGPDDPSCVVYFMIAGGLAALAGHSCSVFLCFKGGKGVATGLGVLLFLAPWETAVVFVVWCVIVGLTRLVSLGSVTAAVLVRVVMWLFGEPVPLIVFGAAAALFVVVRHKENIRRLVQGKELKAEHLGKK